MVKRISILLSSVILLLSLSACNNETEHKTGWQNPDENSTKIQDEDESTTIGKEDGENSDKSENKPVFSESAAQSVGTLNSKIYGKLNIYLQSGYFLLIDEYGDTKFTIFAQDFSTKDTDGKIIPLICDMDFDGNEDFAVCYYKDALNAYYYCFLWDSTARTFSYYLPLSSLSNPTFNDDTRRITAKYRYTATKYREDIYMYSESELKQTSSETKENTSETDSGPEIMNSELSILENANSAQISLASKKGAHSKWVCKIDNEKVVTLSSEYYNEYTYTYEFLLSAVSQGTTTVIFRFETVENHEYVEERIINVTVDEYGNLKVIVPTQE